MEKLWNSLSNYKKKKLLTDCDIDYLKIDIGDFNELDYKIRMILHNKWFVELRFKKVK